MSEEHLSSSKPQNEIEAKVIEELNEKFDCIFQNTIEGYPFRPDFFIEKEGIVIVGEIYAGIDKLNPAQKKKIITDCFKLVYIEKCLSEKYPNEEFRKIMVFVDDKIKALFIDEKDKNKSWVKNAIKSFGIELLLAETITEEDKEKLRNAKINQQKGMGMPSTKK